MRLALDDLRGAEDFPSAARQISRTSIRQFGDLGSTVSDFV
jgi:hypothetical protein